MTPPENHERVRAIVRQVKSSPAFHQGVKGRSTNYEKVLDKYAASYPNAPQHPATATDINRLNGHLKYCFRTDRSLWLGQQQLHIPPKIKEGSHSAHSALAIEPISKILEATEVFWFHQAARLRKRTTDRQLSFIVNAEPLFFYSEPLKAYIRFLEINHDGSMELADAPKLLNEAQSYLTKILMKGSANVREQKLIEEKVRGLQMVPVRHYLPAGDSYAGREIRRWFQDHFEDCPDYKEVQDVAERDRRDHGLVLIGNRRTLPPIAKFDEAHPELVFRLTEHGISEGGGKSSVKTLRRLDDENGPEGTRLSRVIVTTWVRSTGNAYTIIGGNHTRALEKVANMLVSDDDMRQYSDNLLRDGRIAERFQMVLDVNLKHNGTRAGVPTLTPGLVENPIVYSHD